eukprot:15676598-Heterocapsa_arctica.AAC.1
MDCSSAMGSLPRGAVAAERAELGRGNGAGVVLAVEADVALLVAHAAEGLGREVAFSRWALLALERRRSAASVAW